MPSTYAHYRLGQQVRRELEGNERKIIEKYPLLYLIGLHGPDILFYYKPLRPNPVNQIGYDLHGHSGKEFFERAKNIINSQKEKEPFLAYTYGVLNHFALDVSCHGYIDEKIAASGISHTEIEVEFDRMLMLMDGKDPLRQNLTEHIVPCMENAEVIRWFYPKTTPADVREALKGMITYNNMLIAPSRIRRFFIYALLYVSGNYKEMHGLLVNYRKNPQCEDSNRQLMQYYCQAKLSALRMISQFGTYLDGSRGLEPIFDYSFGSQLVGKEVVQNGKEVKHAV